MIRYLTEEDIEEYLKSGRRENKNRQRAYKEGKRIVLKNREELVEYVNASIQNKGEMRPVAYTRVSSKLAEEVYAISGGNIDVAGYFVELISSDIVHFYREHSTVKEAGDVKLTFKDIIYSLEHINDGVVEKIVSYNDGTKRLYITLKCEEGYIVVLETISKSAGSIRLKTEWKVNEEKYFRKVKNSSNTAGTEKSTNSTHDDPVSVNSIA